MSYELNSEQQMLQDAAKNFLAQEVTTERVRKLEKSDTGFSQELWEQMAELGWMGLNIPEAYGGFEATFMDLAVILEEMGGVGLASPFFPTVVLGTELVGALGSDAQKRALLPQVAIGKSILTLAYAGAYEPESAGHLPVSAEQVGAGYRLNGRCLMVPFARQAHVILGVAKDNEGGASLFLLDRSSPGLEILDLQTTADDRQCELELDDVSVEANALLGDFGKSWPILQAVLHRAAVAKCAEMVGGARRAMEITVDYSKERVQFGRPIGSFQAVQHHCANMLTYLDTSALITRNTCRDVGAGAASAEQMAKCKAWVSDACRKLLAIAHQVHAGVGFMEESDLQIYFRRIKAAEQSFGNAIFHREIVARELGIGGRP